MAKGKRKGKNKNYPVGHCMHQQASNPPLVQNSKHFDQPKIENVSSPIESVRTVDEKWENISSASRKDAKSPRFQENLDHPIPSTSKELARSSETPSNEEAVDLVLNQRQIQLPAKLAPGNLGKKIRLVSNLFNLNLLPDRNIFHYGVQITKEQIDTFLDSAGKKKKYCMKTSLNREIVQKMLNDNKNFRQSYAVYDGKYNLYTPSPLQLIFPYKTKVLLENQSKNPGQMRVYLVEINPVEKDGSTNAIKFSIFHELYQGVIPNAVDLQGAMMALETILRHSPALSNIPIGHNFYNPRIEHPHPLNGGIKIWFGFHQSEILGQWGPMVNLNTSATTFFQKQTLIEYVANLHDISNELPDDTIKRLAKELRNVNMITYHLGYKNKRRVIDVTEKSADRLEFELKSDSDKTTRNITVSQYFREVHDINLTYPHLPCVQVSPKERNIYLPLEICNIPEGEHSRNELSNENKRKMIEFTALPAVKKFNKIMNIRKKWANFNNDDHLKSYGISVDNEPISLDGRVLEAPKLIYHGNKTIQPTKGSWNIKNLKFFEGANVSKWVIISLEHSEKCRREDLENFSKRLQEIAEAAGLELGKPRSIKIILGRGDFKMKNASAELRDIQRNQIQLTIVVVPNNDEFDFYTRIKQVAEVDLGLLTQCMKSRNAIKCNASTLSNLCLKINAKMNGINHILSPSEIPQIMAKPVIIMGADVCHPGVTDSTGISVASVSASLNMTLSRYAVVCRLQKNEKSKKKSVEMILELTDMVEILLKVFWEHTGHKPEKIIFFRDGVSNSQFYDIKEKEVVAIRKACKKLQKTGYEPAITFITVQKRHSVRLKPEDEVRNKGNIPPGSIVDTDIVHSLHNHFYLCSHEGIQGTSRPGHYTLLEDDNKLTADELQTLAYYSCTLSFRCNRTISIPVPVYYADLAAYRTRKRLSLLPDYVKRMQAKSQVILKEILNATELADVIKDTMYFI